MVLTKIGSNQLQSFERSKLIIPTREWGDKLKPEVFYSLNQVIALRVIAKLKKILSNREIKKLAEYIQQYGLSESASKKYLLFCNNNLYWVEGAESLETIVNLYCNAKKQFLIVEPIGNIYSDLEKFKSETCDNSIVQKN